MKKNAIRLESSECNQRVLDLELHPRHVLLVPGKEI
jgi:hypothetical protein